MTQTTQPTPPVVANPRGASGNRGGWLEERLGIQAFYLKYGRKAFPVHSTFFLGEMALFSFVILILTGIYLGFIYVPSNADVTINGQTVPEAYASVQLIESIPIANLFRNVHHWASDVMIASILLHSLRVFFTGTYRKPREINWCIGVVLLGLTLMAGFVGYSLPYDAYAVTATGIGYSIARSIPWGGRVASELFFGGAFPTLGSIPRLYTIHVFVVPMLIALVLGVHLLIVVKQKHSQPGYAKRVAEPGRVLGVPLWPYQALLAIQLLMLLFGALFLLSALLPPHQLADFGPPGPTTPEVKPDWYLLWIYGFLKIVPSWANFSLLGGRVGSNFLGGLLFPALIFGLMTLTPFIDRTNRHVSGRFEYLEPPRQGPIRMAAGFGMLSFLASLYLAAYYDQLGLSLGQIWAIVLVVPLVVAAATYAFARLTAPEPRFDPRTLDEMPRSSGPARAAMPEVVIAETTAPVAASTSNPVRTNRVAVSPGPARSHAEDYVRSLAAARAERDRQAIVAALRRAGTLADAIEQLHGQDLLEALQTVDALRLGLAESTEALEGAVWSHEIDGPPP